VLDFEKDFNNYWNSFDWKLFPQYSSLKSESTGNLGERLYQESFRHIFSSFYQSKSVVIKTSDISQAAGNKLDYIYDSIISEIRIHCELKEGPHILPILDFGLNSPNTMAIILEMWMNC
jgi:hypothetical protein